jgi:hypothetical protein
MLHSRSTVPSSGLLPQQAFLGCLNAVLSATVSSSEKRAEKEKNHLKSYSAHCNLLNGEQSNSHYATISCHNYLFDLCFDTIYFQKTTETG